jgi:ribosome recycling factor
VREMTKKELLEQNEELKEALSRIRDEINDLLDEDESDESDSDDDTEDSEE